MRRLDWNRCKTPRRHESLEKLGEMAATVQASGYFFAIVSQTAQ
jgi:hypothetical protein